MDFGPWTIFPDFSQPGRDVATVAPRQASETEVQDPVQFVEWHAHIERRARRRQPIALRFLHQREAVQVEPAHGACVEALDSDVLARFQSAAQRPDAVFDEIEPGALHHVVLCAVSGGDDFFRHAEGGADLRAGEFAILEELQVAAGKLRLDDLGRVPEQQRFIGHAGPAPPLPQGRAQLLALFRTKLLLRPDDQSELAVVFHHSIHVLGGGVIRRGRQAGDLERRQAAPEIEGIRQLLVPHFLRQQHLAR